MCLWLVQPAHFGSFSTSLSFQVISTSKQAIAHIPHICPGPANSCCMLRRFSLVYTVAICAVFLHRSPAFDINRPHHDSFILRSSSFKTLIFNLSFVFGYLLVFIVSAKAEQTASRSWKGDRFELMMYHHFSFSSLFLGFIWCSSECVCARAPVGLPHRCARHWNDIFPI